MALAIFQGRDCIVAFQDCSSIGIYGNCLGTSGLFIARPRSWPVPFEAVRDRVFRGEAVAFADAPVEMPAGMMLVSRTYDPMIDRGGEVCGIVAQGWSRPARSRQDEQDLAATLADIGLVCSPSRIELLCKRLRAAASGGQPLPLQKRLQQLRRQREPPPGRGPIRA
jgi:hypothetical protein